ncbi:hypothetical protein GQ457_18G011770 [Hibiscus cannabinus]
MKVRLSQLPVRYLGVPLVTRKLSVKYCSPLIDSIRSRLSQWANRKLRYGGRLQLIKVVKIMVAEGSLWIAWIKKYVLRPNGFDNVVIRPHHSWIIQKLLKLRREAHNLFGFVIDLRSVKVCWIWENSHEQPGKLGWHKVLWFPLHVPKHSLASWMVVLDWLCCVRDESKNHLFFLLPLLTWHLDDILRCCGINRAILGWDDEINWAIARLKGKSMHAFVLRLAWNAFIYFILEERNRRTFCSIERDANVILSVINEFIQV